MIKKKLSIANIFLWNMMIFTFCSTFVTGYLWVSYEYKQFINESNKLRKEYIESQKKIIQNEVLDAINCVKNYRSVASKAMQAAQSKKAAIEDYIKKGVLNRLASIRFGNQGYLFGSTYSGEPLFSNGKITLGSANIWELTDSNGVKIIQKQREAIRNPDGGYIKYFWKKLDTFEPAPKISFVKGISEWEWMIGAGVYLDDIENEIIHKKNKIQQELKKQLLIIIGLLFAQYIIIFVIAKYISFKARTSFKIFSQFFSTASDQSVKIDKNKVHFLEFASLADAANKMVDIHIKTQQALKESEETYRNLFQNAQVGLFRTKPKEGVFVECNDAMAHMFGYGTREECIKDYPLANGYVDKGVRKKMLDMVKKYGEFKNYEARFRRKDGGIFWLRYSAKYYKEQDWIEGVGEDVTEIKKAEQEKAELQEKLNQSKKMEALGLLAGGVAHDLNNILSGIVSYPDLILIDLPENSPLKKPVETIKNAGIRAAAVVSDLLTIARGIASPKEINNLNIIVEQYLISPEYQELKTKYKDIIITTSLNYDLLNTSCSPIHINKSLMNLVINACEALENHGVINISTKNLYVDKKLQAYNTIDRGEYIVLTVSDNGPGIASKDLERIFEPFYTKKLMGRSGTGLGLAIVWNTIQDHGGHINVNSNESGTIFELYFPATRQHFVNVDKSISFENYKGNGQKILIIDDEPGQREIAGNILKKLGYNVHALSCGEDAVEYLKDNNVDLVLLDMIMSPGINGFETYKQIIKIHPNQKAIIVSGYAETADVKKTQSLGAGQYVKKPYLIEKIGKAVYEALTL